MVIRRHGGGGGGWRVVDHVGVDGGWGLVHSLTPSWDSKTMGFAVGGNKQVGRVEKDVGAFGLFQ